MKKLLVVILVVLLVLAGCGASGKNVDNSTGGVCYQFKGGQVVECLPIGDENIQPPGKTSLFREIDSEAGVVCYHFRSWQGIDCLPISDTKLSP
ncbi:MAG: hypothetical protein GY797_34205 [Deltaproteobacteria bacterium]|nr:hypothetical protein [Deltaproteobacteria bacterium]